MIKPNNKGAEHFAQNSLTYDKRVDDGLKVMAKACLLSTNTEVKRLRRVRDLTGGAFRYPSADEIQDGKGKLPLPVMFEFMLGLGKGKLRGFGYRTVGRKEAKQTRGNWLGVMLRGAGILMLENGCSRNEIAALGQMTRFCYPNPELLEVFDDNAAMMLVGLIPKETNAKVQVFLNPRMGDPQGYEKQLASMLQTINCGSTQLAASFYDHIYKDGVSLYGVGAEFDCALAPRAYIYVLFDKLLQPQIAEDLIRLPVLDIDKWKSEIARANQSLTTLVDSIGDSFIKPTIEMAIVLQQDRMPHLKFSVMLNDGYTMEALSRLARLQHCSIKEVESVVKAVNRRAAKPVALGEAIHSIALQSYPEKPAVIDLTLNIPL